jgi:hypothetical protein
MEPAGGPAAPGKGWEGAGIGLSATNGAGTNGAGANAGGPPGAGVPDVGCGIPSMVCFGLMGAAGCPALKGAGVAGGTGAFGDNPNIVLLCAAAPPCCGCPACGIGATASAMPHPGQ